MILGSAGVVYPKAQKSGSVPVNFSLTAGTGTIDVGFQGPNVQIKSNTVICDAHAPDLTITGIIPPSGFSPVPWYYTVTVRNIGDLTAEVSNVDVQGFFTSSTDTTNFPPPGGQFASAGGDPACGTDIQPFATSLAPGASVDVVVGCGNSGPTVPADKNLMVMVDHQHVLAESFENNNVAVISLT
jgi:hypothetical protein